MIQILLALICLTLPRTVEAKDTAAWRFDLKFDSKCGVEFSVVGALFFNGHGKKAGKIFAGAVPLPYLYAELDEVPDMKTARMSVMLEVMSSLENVMDGPRKVLEFNISFIHLRSNFKLRMRNIILHNETADYTRMGTKFAVDFDMFYRLEMDHDCFYDKTYYLHREIPSSRFSCPYSLVCRCDNGLLSQNCQPVPYVCYKNGGYYDKQTINTICTWKMQACCPEVDCPVEPLTYCVNSADMGVFWKLKFCTVLLVFVFVVINFSYLQQ